MSNLLSYLTPVTGTARAVRKPKMGRTSRATPAPAPTPAPAKRTRGAAAKGAADASSAHAKVDDPLDDNPGVTSKKMSWRMLLATKDGMTAASGIETESFTSNDIHEDSAEWQHLQEDRQEQANVEKASADANNMDEYLWCSDTTTATLSSSLRARVKAVADGAQACTFSQGGGGS